MIFAGIFKSEPQILNEWNTNRWITHSTRILELSWSTQWLNNKILLVKKKFFVGMTAALCLGQVTHRILLINFKRSRRVSRSKSRSQSQDVSGQSGPLSQNDSQLNIDGLWRVMTYTTKNFQILMKKFFVRCSKSSLVIYETYLMSLLAETKRRVIPATIFFHKYLATFYFK